MSYLICEKCGKQYPLPEGKESFNYEKCSCGGKLVYAPSLNVPLSNLPLSKEEMSNKNELKTSSHQSPIKWRGIFIGLLFLFMSLTVSGMIIFGDNVPTNTSDINPEDFPMQILIYSTTVIIVLTIVAGSISAYLSGSKNYMEGALNGGMVGVILGFIVGTVGGVMIFIGGTFLLGLLSMIGGIIGTIPRKRSKK